MVMNPMPARTADPLLKDGQPLLQWLTTDQMVKPDVETEAPSEISTRSSVVFCTSVVFSGFITGIITIIWNGNRQLVFRSHMAEPHRTASVDNFHLRWERKPYKMLAMNRGTDQVEDMLEDVRRSHLFSAGSMFPLHRVTS